MDMELNEDERALVDVARSLVEGRFPLELVRAAERAERVMDVAGWAALGEAGVFSLSVPEADGGAGLGMTGAALVFEELGRGIVPGPLVATHLAGRLAAGAVDPGVGPVGALAGALEGSLMVGMVRRSATSAALVEHRSSLDFLLVAEADGGLSLVDADDLPSGVALASLDPLTPLSALDALATGAPLGGGPAFAAAWQREWRVLTAALCSGIARATCDRAVEYAKGRKQFAKPIGSFQAVKHLCADMLVRAESARAATDAAAVTLDQPDVGDPVRAASSAALVATEAATLNAKSCIQVHGGMGFTWEVPIHLYLMRAKVLTASLGPLDTLEAEVAARW